MLIVQSGGGSPEHAIERKRGGLMTLMFPREEKELSFRRREIKKKVDFENKNFKHEVNLIFNTFYKKQVSALYREVIRPR